MLQKAFIIGIIVSLFSLAPLPAKALEEDAARDFITSCAYGAVAGSLVGAAALAFTDNPGANLNMVARGASLGLYAGIVLGLYVVSSMSQPQQEPESAKHLLPAKKQSFVYDVAPVFGNQGFEGAALKLSYLDF